MYIFAIIFGAVSVEFKEVTEALILLLVLLKIFYYVNSKLIQSRRSYMRVNTFLDHCNIFLRGLRKDN